MDSIAHIENGKFIGRTNFKSGLVNNVVALSAKEISGVAGIAKNFKRFNFRDLLNTNLFNTNGVQIYSEKDGIVIDVCVALEYGYSASEVSYKVQENVINVASNMLDKRIKAVNVKIADVIVPHLEG